MVKRRRESQRRRFHGRSRGQGNVIAGSGDRTGPRAKEYRQLLENGKTRKQVLPWSS